MPIITASVSWANQLSSQPIAASPAGHMVIANTLTSHQPLAHTIRSEVIDLR